MNTRKFTNAKPAHKIEKNSSLSPKWVFGFVLDVFSSLVSLISIFLLLTVAFASLSILYIVSTLGYTLRTLISKTFFSLLKHVLKSAKYSQLEISYQIRLFGKDIKNKLLAFRIKSKDYKSQTKLDLHFPKVVLPKFSFKSLAPSIKLSPSKFFSALFSKVRFSIPKPKFVRPKVFDSIKKTKITLPHIGFRIPRFSRFWINFSIITSLLLISSCFLFWFFILKDLPSPDKLTTRKINVSTKIYDRNGVLLYKIYKDENRTIIKLEDIPQTVRLATLAAEDAEFYGHPGFSVRGITRSIFKNLENGELTGGSTITQQLVKNALLSPEKTFTRKLKEITLAVMVEMRYSKDQILEMYLNEVSYGGTAYGIQEASEAYFGKDVQSLTLEEAAFLAGLPKSPSKYSPFSGSDAGLNRQKDVLHLMKVNGFITADLEKAANEKQLSFVSDITDIKAPHFVMYVRSQLADQFGEEVVETGGLEVHTTLDYSIQTLAEQSLADELDKLKNMHVGNGGVVVLDPKTGDILAMVGSKNYFDIANDGNVNVTTRLRSPGSSIKVVNYAQALSENYTPATVIKDEPITFKIPGQADYSPKNYDGKFHGSVTIRSALAQSLNIPAVKVLSSYGVNKMINLGEKMGITTWGDRSRFGLSLTLGGGEVRLLDLSQVYATLANYGKKVDLRPITKVVNYKGKTLENYKCTSGGFKNLVEIPKVNAAEPEAPPCQGEQVLDPGVAYLITNILSDNNARTPAFGRYSQLVIANHPEVAVKTGTSNDLRDNLAVGYTKDYVVAVWVGNNDNSPMSRVASGLTGSSTIFHNIMTGLLSQKNTYAWSIPSDVSKVAVCSVTGTLPCDGCPTRTEYFLNGNKPALACKPDQLLVSESDK